MREAEREERRSDEGLTETLLEKGTACKSSSRGNKRGTEGRVGRPSKRGEASPDQK